MNRNLNSEEHLGFGLGAEQGAKASFEAVLSQHREGEPECDHSVVAARMDYVIVTFSSYYFSQVVSDLCLQGKSGAPFLLSPSLLSSDKCFSSPFTRGSVLPRIELGFWAASSRTGFMTEGLLFPLL